MPIMPRQQFVDEFYDLKIEDVLQQINKQNI